MQHLLLIFVLSTPRVRKLLKAGVSVNASDGATSDNKALHWAASYGNADIVKLLCGKCLFLLNVHFVLPMALPLNLILELCCVIKYLGDIMAK